MIPPCTIIPSHWISLGISMVFQRCSNGVLGRVRTHLEHRSLEYLKNFRICLYTYIHLTFPIFNQLNQSKQKPVDKHSFGSCSLSGTGFYTRMLAYESLPFYNILFVEV